MSIQVSTHIDQATKQQFDRICDTIGISPSTAISIFIKGVINNNGIPFPVTAPPDTPAKLPRSTIKGKWRISEKVLIFFTIACGGIGALTGMCLLRHKTRKLKFEIAVA